MRAFYAAVLACAFTASVIEAQEARPTRIITGGILNSRAVELPLPEYPESLRQARIGGIVAVDVVIDEKGAVISATASPDDARERKNADGTRADPVPLDPAFREAAEAAARRARFAPVILNGSALKVKGKVLYNFIVDNSDPPPRVGAINGPLLNGKAISFPQPDYSAAARSAGASGSVTVQIMIDENGNVVSASALRGHLLLRPAAVEAAMKAKFRPVPPNSQVVTLNGLLEYNFTISRANSQ